MIERITVTVLLPRQNTTDLLQAVNFTELKQLAASLLITSVDDYSRFQVTFHCNIPNFVTKFGSSFRSSKVHFRIRKPVCKLGI